MWCIGSWSAVVILVNNLTAELWEYVTRQYRDVMWLQRILLSLLSYEPCSFSSEHLDCIVTKILYAKPINEICDWDDRVKVITWVDVEPVTDRSVTICCLYAETLPGMSFFCTSWFDSFCVFVWFVFYFLLFFSVSVSVLRVQFYIKLEVLREHRPPPNASITELLNDFCRASVLCLLTTWQFFLDPWSGTDSRIRIMMRIVTKM